MYDRQGHSGRTSRLPAAALALLGLGGLAACGGSGDAGLTGVPPPPPPPAEPNVTCTESSASGEGWQVQATGVEGAISRIQFLDVTTGRAVRRNRQGHALTLLRTSDGGSTWCAEEITSDRTTDMGHFLAFLGPDIGFTGGESCTLMTTKDGGASWTRRAICFSSRWLLAIEPVDADRIWVGGGGGLLFHSDNGGTSWTQVAVSGLDQPVSGIAFVGADLGLLVGGGEAATCSGRPTGARAGRTSAPGASS